MVSRRLGRRLEIAAYVLPGVALVAVEALYRAHDRALHHVADIIFYVCIFSSIPLLAAAIAVMPPEVWRERATAIASGTGGRIIKKAPLLFIIILVLTLMPIGPEAKRNHIHSAASLALFFTWFVAEPLYIRWKTRRTAGS